MKMTMLKWLTMGALMGFSVSMGVSCGAPKCSASNCAFGCCDATGACQNGSADSQCGASGLACTSCVLGQTCSFGRCVISGGAGGGFGGGSSGTGGGSSGTGGGSSTGGGTGTGGGSSTGGGSGNNPLCIRFNSASLSFFAGRTTCTSGSTTLSSNPNLLANCNAGVASCSSGSDQDGLATYAGCLESAQPCTPGNEAAAVADFSNCVGVAFGALSETCIAAISSSSTGGGGGSSTGGGSGTGGGTSTGGGTGTGGGTSTGGGTGTGGGTASCTTISNLVIIGGDGTYDTTTATFANGVTSASSPADVLSLELWWSTSTTLPVTRDLSQTTYGTCTSCAVLRRGCDLSTGTCTGGEYLGRTGTMTVTAAPRGVAGTFTASISNVRFEEWVLDPQVDMAVLGGNCVTVGTSSLSVQVVAPP